MHEGGSAFGRQRRGVAFGRAQHGGTGAGIDRHFIVLGLDAAKGIQHGLGHFAFAQGQACIRGGRPGRRRDALLDHAVFERMKADHRQPPRGEQI